MLKSGKPLVLLFLITYYGVMVKIHQKFLGCQWLYRKTLHFKKVVAESEASILHTSARKSYLHFYHLAGEAILCSNFFCYLLFFLIKIKLLWLQTSNKFWIVYFNLNFENQQKTQFCPKCQLQPSCTHMTNHHLPYAVYFCLCSKIW